MVEVIDEPIWGVESELASFFDAIQGVGDTDGERLGDPSEALKDVALIEAALGSEGGLVDLVALGGEGMLAPGRALG